MAACGPVTSHLHRVYIDTLLSCFSLVPEQFFQHSLGNHLLLNIMRLSLVLTSIISLTSAAVLGGAQSKPYDSVRTVRDSFNPTDKSPQKTPATIPLVRKQRDANGNLGECAFCYKKCPFISSEACTSCKAANCSPIIKDASNDTSGSPDISTIIERSVSYFEGDSAEAVKGKCEICYTLCLGGPGMSCTHCAKFCKPETEIENYTEMDASLVSLNHCSGADCF